MRDPRLDRLGELIAGYSLDLQPGEIVRIEGDEVAEDLLYALYRAALRRGANAYLQVGLERLGELKLAEASEEQLAHVAQLEWDELEQLEAVATVWGERNTRNSTNVEPERFGRLISARRALSERGWERIAAGDLRWCGTLAPVEAYAQDAEMSLEEYESFVFGACHVSGDGDPVAHWRGVSK
ncbi:MAG: aminopeptidase, partial [Actinomycetota bacterium]|nr:aminopeptidase [Actinomycetota bacterium]